MQLEVELADGKTEQVTVKMSDIVKFESHWSISIAKIGQEMKISHLLWLAWTALSREGKVKADFEKWVDEVGGITASNPKASKG